MKMHSLVCDRPVSDMEEGISLTGNEDGDAVIVFPCEQLEQWSPNFLTTRTGAPMRI